MAYVCADKLFFGGKFMKSIEKSKTIANPVRSVFNGVLMAAALSIAALAFASCGGATSTDIIGETDHENEGGGGGKTLNFYVGEKGDDEYDGKSEKTAFATLEKAYEAALQDKTAGYTNTAIVVLTDLSKTGVVELSALVDDTVIEKSITIKGGGATVPTLTRIADEENTSDKNGRVLKVSGGAKIKFENIKINGITSPDYYHGALGIGEAAVSEEPEPPKSRVTLGKGTVITGKKDGASGYTVITKESDAGSGVFIGLYGELVMEQGSKVTGCETSDGDYAYAPVTVAGGTFTMNGGEISKNTINNKYAYGGGVYVGPFAVVNPSFSIAAAGEFTMSGGEISGNEIVCTEQADGGGVYVSNHQDVKFTMNGGKISGNTITGGSQYAYIGGGGVYASGNFTMSNSEISGNIINNTGSTGKTRGGGVYVGSKFEMTDSLITGNKVSAYTVYGGGVSLDVGSTFEMTASKITDNEAAATQDAACGGGVSVYGKGTKFNMISGKISGNKAASTTTEKAYGGGVSLLPSSDTNPEFTMTGGFIYGQPSGDGDLLGNTAANGAALYVDKDTKKYDNDITVYPISD
jgi:hypothetical protein